MFHICMMCTATATRRKKKKSFSLKTENVHKRLKVTEKEKEWERKNWHDFVWCVYLKQSLLKRGWSRFLIVFLFSKLSTGMKCMSCRSCFIHFLSKLKRNLLMFKDNVDRNMRTVSMGQLPLRSSKLKWQSCGQVVELRWEMTFPLHFHAA